MVMLGSYSKTVWKTRYAVSPHSPERVRFKNLILDNARWTAGQPDSRTAGQADKY